MNIFDQYRQTLLSLPFDQAKKLVKFREILNVAEDLVNATKNLTLPAQFHLENESVRNIHETAEKLEKLFEYDTHESNSAANS